MTGEELYALWVAANEESGIGVDSWEDLTVDDKVVWEAFASLVDEKVEAYL